MAKAAPETARISPDMRERYEPVIGLEVHAQLRTQSKIFCGCSTRFGDPPNTNVCQVCLGLPGTLPVLNRRALEMAIRAALALHCTVQERSRFARKNYFYPDLPKGYQISMYELPLAEHGWLDIEFDGGKKHIGITRLHLEEDAAKAMHEGFPDSAEKTYIDYNRCGTPLIEIVSEPDLRTSAEAYAYLTTLKQVLLYTGVSDCNMEEGSLRCDANVSVRRRGSDVFGTKVEVKNLNSFRYLARALEYEIERHIGVLESGGRLEQETRLWNQAAGRTDSMRTKERAHDYRYFPEPDLLPVSVMPAWREEIARTMPELPAAKRDRFVRDYGITPYDAGVLTETCALGDYFEEVVKRLASADAWASYGKVAANWIQAEVMRYEVAKLALTREHSGAPVETLIEEAAEKLPGKIVEPSELANLLKLVTSQTITIPIAKSVFRKMVETGKSATQIIAEGNISQVTDVSTIEKACREVIAKNPENVAKYKAGNEGVFKFFVGQVMKATRGQANPQLVNGTLKRLLA